MKATVFLTGSTGFIGGNLLLRLIEDPTIEEVFTLVRAHNKQEAYDRLFQHLCKLSVCELEKDAMQKVEIVTGDIVLHRLGLDDLEFNHLVNRVTHIIHCAANVKFNLPVEKIRRINVGGTRNIIHLAKEIYNNLSLQSFAYLGTAYVSGNRSGVIYEHELRKPETFSNSYEQTKFEAEVLVRSYMQELPVTIFRPSIVVGDSKTGIITTNNGLYFLLRFIYNAALRYIPGSHKTHLDIVPVDYVCDAMHYILFKGENTSRKTFHLTSGDRAVQIKQVLDSAKSYFEGTEIGSRFAQVTLIPIWLYRMAKRVFLRKKSRFSQYVESLAPYLINQPVFDNSTTRNALQDTSLKMPEFNIYFKHLLKYSFK